MLVLGIVSDGEVLQVHNSELVVCYFDSVGPDLEPTNMACMDLVAIPVVHHEIPGRGPFEAKVKK